MLLDASPSRGYLVPAQPHKKDAGTSDFSASAAETGSRLEFLGIIPRPPQVFFDGLTYGIGPGRSPRINLFVDRIA